MRSAALLLAGCLLAGCTSAEAGPRATVDVSTPRPVGAGLTAGIDSLTFEITVPTPTVPSGGEVTYELTIRNDSGATVTDPGCLTAQGLRGVIPADQPDGNLWMEPIVDCLGAFVMPPGYEDTREDTVYAHSQNGQPFEPGEYLVAREFRGGVQQRLLVPITVTAEVASE